jgi:hypothetical protein
MPIDQDVLAAIISGSFNLGGGILSGIGQGQISAAQMAQQAEMARANAAQAQFNQQASQANQGLQSTQMDPMAKAKAEQQRAFVNAMMSGMQGGKFHLPQGGFDKQTMAPYGADNQLASETNFYHNVANASPNSPTPDLSLLYGDKGKAAMGDINTTQTNAQGRLTTERDAVNAALNAAANGGDSGGGNGPGSRAAALALAVAPTAAKVIPGLINGGPTPFLPPGTPGSGATTAMPAPAPPAVPGGVPLVGGANPSGGFNLGGQSSAPGNWTGRPGPYFSLPGGNASTDFLHEGGVVHGPAGVDQVPAQLTAGEGVLTQNALRKLGGASKLNQLNRPKGKK